MRIFRSVARVWNAWGGEFARQLWFELLKMFGRRRTHIGFGVFVLVSLVFTALFKREKAVAGIRELMERRTEKMGPLKMLVDLDYYFSALTMSHLILSVTVVLIGGLFIALVAGDIVSKEEEDGTLRMVLSRPVTRGRLLAVKFSACGVFTFLMVVFAVLWSLVVGFVFWRSDGGLFMTSSDLKITAFHKFGAGLWRSLLVIPFLTLAMFVITSLAFLFSCLRMKPATATILTIALLFTDMVLKRMEPLQDIKHLFITSRMSSWQLVLGRKIDWWLMGQNFFVLGMICGLCFLFGWIAFSRRDFKS